MQRYRVALADYGENGTYLEMECDRCGCLLDSTPGTTLAELVQRAEEHGEVCR